MDPGQKPHDPKDDKPFTMDERHEVAVDALRSARWRVRELTDTDIKENLPKVAHLPHEINDEFIVRDEYVMLTGSGVWITPRGTLYMRMLDGL